MTNFWSWLGGLFTLERILIGAGVILLVVISLLLFNKFWKPSQVPKGKIPPLIPE